MGKDSMKKVLITGGSKGVGRALAIELARQGAYDLVLVGRNTKGLASVAEKAKALNPIMKIECLTLDLCRPEQIQELMQRVPVVDVLINNAGSGAFGRFLSVGIAEHQSSLLLNCMTPLQLCHFYGGKMKSQGPGLIVNMSSLAALFPVPYFSIYSATKAFLLCMGETLDFELREYGIRVMTVCPAGIKTEFFTAAGLPERMEKKYERTLASPEFIAREIGRHILSPNPILIPGLPNRILVFLGKFFPRAFNLKTAARIYREFLS
jgi:hypothetical protein